MEITVERPALLKALSRVHRAVERRNTIPILDNVLLATEGAGLRLRATDLDIDVADKVPAEVGASGATTVPAILLHDIVKKLPDGPLIAMELSEGRDKLTVRAGKSRFTLRTLPETDFPDLTVGQLTHRFTMPAADLGRLISKTTFAISSDATRYYLNGIYFHPMLQGNRQTVRAVATDGHRLAQVEMAAPAGAEEMPPVIVPRKTVGEAQRLLEGGGDITIELSATKIRFVAGDAALTSKLIDGTFPDYTRVVPAGNDKVMEVDKGDLERLIDRVATITGGNDRAVKLSLTPGRLEVSARNSETAAVAVDDIDASYEAGPLDIGFNSRYLLDIIGRIDGATAVLKLGDAGSPALVGGKDAPDALYVLMPMRV